jgi:hypothetical protein
MVPWESTLEFDFLYHLDADPRVSGFATQPGCLDLNIDGELKMHHPDVLVIYASGARWIIDIKSDEDAEGFEASGVKAATAKAALARGYGYDVKTTSEIRREPDLWNAKLISDCRMRTLPHGLEERVRSQLAAGPLSPRSLAPRIEMEVCHAYGTLLHFVAVGVANFDRSNRVTAETNFRLVA